MGKFISALFKGKIILIILSITCMLLGFLLAYHFCHDNGYIIINFKYKDDVVVELDNFTSDDTINKTKELEYSLYTGNYVSTYKYVDIKNISIEEINDYYQIKINNDAFNDSNIKNASSTAKGFLRNLCLIAIMEDNYENYKKYDYSYVTDKGYTNFVNGISEAFDVEFYEQNSLDDTGSLLTNTDNNKAKMTLIFTLSGLSIGLVASLILIFIFSRKHDFNTTKEYNNGLYKTPFHITTFKESALNLKSIKCLTTIAILLSLVMVCKFLPIPSGFGKLGITFGFLFLATACMIYGPVPALLIGALSDIIGFLIKPDGMFFPGYTLNAMLACFTYALCFYKTHITFTRVLISRTIVNIFVNGFLGALWDKIINDYTWEQYMTNMLITSMPKNIAYLLPQSLILFIVLKAVTPALKATNHINDEVTVSLF